MTEIQPAPTSLEEVEECLKDVIDPELGVNVVDLGLVYGLEYGEDGALLISMTLTTAACPLTDILEEQVGKVLDGIVDEWRLNWVWMPPWGPERITEDG
ncbi:metal-sulfur cluster assembly factor, partial [Sinomonas notoginsengisoli]